MGDFDLILTKDDLIATMHNLWQTSEKCIFIDVSGEETQAISITFFREGETATLGVVYNEEEGGTARIMNHLLEPVVHCSDVLTKSDYQELNNLMLEIQQTIGK